MDHMHRFKHNPLLLHVGILISILCGFVFPRLVAAQLWQRYADRYYGPYTGRVIDAETKQPLSGAVVLAVWLREVNQLIQTSTLYYNSREVLTDANGEFTVRAKDVETNAPPKTLRPNFVIFYRGYGFFPGHQIAPQGFIGGIFEGKGAVVELPKLKTNAERLRVIGELPPILTLVPHSKMPKLLKLRNLEEAALGLQPNQ
jgi:hypothetical protein